MAYAAVERQLQNERQPASPTYMSYIYQVPEVIRPEASNKSMKSQPATNETWSALHMQGVKTTHEHFHTPTNNHNKFLSEVREADKHAYRDLPRMAPPPFDRSGRSSIRPQSADPLTRRHSSPPGHVASSGNRHGAAGRPLTGRASASLIPLDTYIENTDFADRNVTPNGAPCYSVSTILEADLELGIPVIDPIQVGDETWRMARVRTYDVPPSPIGYGEGGKRPFHQDYAHYKYFGFGGKGAKTSWAYNPKQSERWRQTKPSPATQRPASGTLVARSKDQPLTVTEAKLVRMYKDHSYVAEPLKSVEILEPYMEHASIATRQPLSRQEVVDKSRKHEQVKVATYRQPIPRRPDPS